MRWLACVSIVVFFWPGVVFAAADTCTLTGATCTIDELPEDLDVAGCTGATPICTGGDANNIIDSADAVVIAGAAVTCSAALAFADSANTGFDALTSGSLTFDKDCAVTQNAELDATGGTFTVDGRVLEGPLTTSPAFDLTDESTTDYAKLGTVIHCPADDGAGAIEEDCEGDEASPGSTDQSALCWPSATFDIAASDENGARFYPEWVAAITDDSSVVFFDPSNTGHLAPHDVNSMYEVDDADTWPATDNCIIIDVAQSTDDPDGGRWPAAERVVVEMQITTLEAKGERTLDALVAGTIASDDQFSGRYLTCKDAAGNFPGWTVGIVRTTDGGAGVDTFLLDPPGLPETVDGASSARDCYIDWGWLTGDPIFVMDPAEYTSASAATLTDSDVTMNGATYSIGQFLIKDIQNLEYLKAGNTKAKNIWFYENSDVQGFCSVCLGSSLIDSTTNIGTFGRHFISGSGGNTDPDMHCSRADGGTMRLEDWHCRYSADDAFFVKQEAGIDVNATIRRLRGSFANGNGESVNMIDCATSTATCVIDARGILAESFTSGTTGDYDLGCNDGGTCRYQGVVSVGNLVGRMSNTADTPSVFTITDALDLGRSDCCTGTTAVYSDANYERLTSQDVFTDTNSMLVNSAAATRPAEYMKKALFISPRVGQTHMFELQDPLVLEEIAVIDPQLTAAASGGTSDSFFYYNGTEAGEVVKIHGLTIAHFPGSTSELERAMRIPHTAAAMTFDFDRHIIVNWQDDDSSNGRAYSTGAANQFADVSWGTSGPYLFNNDLDTPSDNWDDLLPASTSRGEPVRFVNPSAGDFRLVPGSRAHDSGAGAWMPGTLDNWAYRVRFGHKKPSELGHNWQVPGTQYRPLQAY